MPTTLPARTSDRPVPSWPFLVFTIPRLWLALRLLRLMRHVTPVGSMPSAAHRIRLALFLARVRIAARLCAVVERLD